MSTSYPGVNGHGRLFFQVIETMRTLRVSDEKMWRCRSIGREMHRQRMHDLLSMVWIMWNTTVLPMEWTNGHPSDDDDDDADPG